MGEDTLVIAERVAAEIDVAAHAIIVEHGGIGLDLPFGLPFDDKAHEVWAYADGSATIFRKSEYGVSMRPDRMSEVVMHTEAGLARYASGGHYRRQLEASGFAPTNEWIRKFRGWVANCHKAQQAVLAPSEKKARFGFGFR
jgi:hypothetical protein